MNLMIGNFDFTDCLQDGSLVLRYYGAMRSSMQATLYFSTRPRSFPQAGKEIVLEEEGVRIWGGIAVETEQICHSTSGFTLHLRGQGYEQILQRYCTPEINLVAQTPSDAVDTIFDHFLDPSDQLIMGTRATGIAQARPYHFFPGKAAAIFDSLAAENGYVWWIDKDKHFHLQPRIPIPPAEKSIDLTRQRLDCLEDIQTLTYRENTAEFKTVQYVYNRTDNVVGSYRFWDRQSPMIERYGGGSYGASTENTVVESREAAAAVAKQIMNTSPGMGEIEFTTDENTFSLGQFVPVIAPVCGIDEEKTFCITQIRAVYFCNKFRYTITARHADSTGASLASWESTLARSNRY